MPHAVPRQTLLQQGSQAGCEEAVGAGSRPRGWRSEMRLKKNRVQRVTHLGLGVVLHNVRLHVLQSTSQQRQSAWSRSSTPEANNGCRSRVSHLLKDDKRAVVAHGAAIVRRREHLRKRHNSKHKSSGSEQRAKAASKRGRTVIRVSSCVLSKPACWHSCERMIKSI